ncbi:MAG: SdpI family protein [Gemmatimonadota bacterium]|nr:SdpI family protein [Gemmatimonadota bacterium]
MRKWIPLLIVAAAFLASAVVYPRLPERMPTHWELSPHPPGSLPTPNGWSDRMWGAWALPSFLLGMWALVRILPKIDPRGSNYAKFGGAFEVIIGSIMLFTLALHIVVLGASLGYPMQMQRIIPIGVGVLLVIIGNLLPRTRSNWFLGIRTPWTLSSDRVWEKTHRLGGRLFVAGGILIIIAGLLWVQWADKILFAVMTVVAFSVLIYSYLEWKREQPVSAAVK